MNLAEGFAAPDLERYSAIASALNSAGQRFIPTGTPFSWTIKIQAAPVQTPGAKAVAAGPRAV